MPEPTPDLPTIEPLAGGGAPPRILPASRLTTPETTTFQAAACQLRILGDFSLLIHERQIEVGSGMMEMLALLGVAGQLSRQRLRTILWPSADPIFTASRLRSLMYRLRHISDEYEIISGPYAIGLNPALAVDYQIASAAASRLLQQSTTPAITLAEAVTLLATELLPMHSWEWLVQYQHAWSRTRLRALEACARQALWIGDRETAIVACERVILAEPFHERSHYLLVVALLREGYEHSARVVYRGLRALLADELGCAPSLTYRELREAASRVMRPLQDGPPAEAI
jgi:DNA-binding SARP family transcriptional activator